MKPEAASPSFRESLIIPLWGLTVLLVVMNTTMFNVALPTVAHDLGLTATAASWIVTGYSILFAISSITYSRLTDFVPIRTLLIIGLVLLGIASVIGLLAHNFYAVLAARLLQAIGAASAPGLGIVLVTRYIPLERRGKSMSVIISAASFGFGLGPIVGGAMTQYFNWNSLFVVTALVLLTIPVFYRNLPEQPYSRIQFDGWGALFIGVGVTGLLLFLTLHPWWALALGILSLVAFWIRIHRVDQPFLQPSLLRNRPYMNLTVMGFVAYVLHFATLFLMPLVIIRLYGQSSAVTGFLIFPGAILTALLSPRIGRLIDRVGNSPVILAGHTTLLAAAFVFALLSTQYLYAITVAYMLMSVSVSAIGSSVSNEMSRILAKHEIGGGMGMAQLTQFFGGALGVALTGASLVWQASAPLQAAYRNIFWVMAAVAAVSLLVSLSYVRASRKTVPLPAVEEAANAG
ncbi:MFS transporter [Paenibacillus elgii]|uniref:MFS transporter n=1 Tax=Paenibacillus elgii TaxID=189691 RepID=A0A2T6G2A9_9BACL|nr:MFS transporter [Paenibacillus elgii]PUA38248.1 MFS transporter [Paenibacillus elgii]